MPIFSKRVKNYGGIFVITIAKLDSKRARYHSGMQNKILCLCFIALSAERNVCVSSTI
jgi:hypothetical protein